METNQIKQLFDNAVANVFEKADLENKINEKMQQTITEAVTCAISGYSIRNIVEKKIQEAINIENLNFSDYGKFVENIFIKAVKDFQFDSLENKLKDIAKSILGTPDKKEYHLWNDLLCPMLIELSRDDYTDYEDINDDEKDESLYNFNGKVKARVSNRYSTKWIHLYIDTKKSDSSYSYTSSTSYYNYAIQLDLKKDKDAENYEIYSAKYGHFTVKDEEITIKHPYKMVEKNLVNVVLKGGIVTNVDEVLKKLHGDFDYDEELY